MESKYQKPIPIWARPFVALLVFGISLVGIGAGVYGVLMGVFWGFLGPILFNNVLKNFQPEHANLVMMVIAGLFAGSFGLFLGLRILQTGRMDVETLMPIKKK